MDSTFKFLGTKYTLRKIVIVNIIMDDVSVGNDWLVIMSEIG